MKKYFFLVCLFLTACGLSTGGPAPSYKYGGTTGAGSLGVHIVQAGDTVWTVSQKYNLDLRGIIEANRLSPPYALKSGARLALPAPQTYTIKKNDSLYSVSRAFNTAQTDLVALNRLTRPYKLAPGRVLKIPHSYDNIVVAEAAPVIAPAPVRISSSPSIPVLPPPPVEAAPLSTLPHRDMPPQPQIPSPAPTLSARDAPVASVPGPMSQRAGRFLKPVAGNIISAYGTKADGQHNDGINIGALRGDPVRAAENGAVVYVGSEIEGYGNMILLRHSDGYVTAYAHLARILVKKGDTVRQGQTIGTVGATGFVDRPQLHFEIRKDNKAVDPTGLI